MGEEFAAFSGAGSDKEVSAAAKALDQIVSVAAAEAPKGVDAVVYALMEEVRGLGGFVRQQTEEISVSDSYPFQTGSRLTDFLGAETGGLQLGARASWRRTSGEGWLCGAGEN